MLIESYEVEVFTPPCEPGAERFAARAHLKVDISEALPLLNAALKGAVYHRAANALTWKKGGHSIAFHAFEVATSNAEDREGAEHELRELIDLVNRTWARRDKIVPDFQSRRRPTAMALYRRLPRTNCKVCGEPTCFTFALKLAAAEKQLAACCPIYQPDHAADLAALQSMVIESSGPGSTRP